MLVVVVVVALKMKNTLYQVPFFVVTMYCGKRGGSIGTCEFVYVHVSIEQCKLLMGELKNKLHGQSMADVDVAVELVCSFVR